MSGRIEVDTVALREASRRVHAMADGASSEGPSTVLASVGGEATLAGSASFAPLGGVLRSVGDVHRELSGALASLGYGLAATADAFEAAERSAARQAQHVHPRP